ncbi:MAG: sensor histidine kinase KdpD [Sandaracinus sp.]
MTEDRDPDARPDPDALLERAAAEVRDATRAKLRLWLGASPGVGKTYAMLENAHRLRREGLDVVVGVVESHGRADTARALRDLPALPRKAIAHRGRTLEELDLDAALARKPAVILVDELAHTNAPGSRHQKRWQDVIELLEAGIEVHSTLNVQHVESLNDVVAQITGIRVRETVPDAILERADEIELVDVPPEVVLERLREGKVYVASQAERAATGFFKEGNLHALRELALRVTAERVDAEVQAWRRQRGIETLWPTRERVLVCVGPSPASARLVRAARRMASALHAPCIAVYVERPGAPLRGQDQARLGEHLRLAEQLGLEVVVLSGPSAADVVLDLARRRSVTRIVAGKPAHARWRDFVLGSFLDDLVRKSGAIDVHVISGDEGASPSDGKSGADLPSHTRPTAYLRAAIPIAVAVAIGALVRERADLADVAMLFVAAIATSGAFLDRRASLFAALIAVVAFDFFFVPPYYTLAVEDLRHLLTFAVMLGAGVLISTLMARIRAGERGARERERRTAALFELTRALAGARDEASIARVATTQIRAVLESEALVLVADPKALEGVRAPLPISSSFDEPDRTVARWVVAHGRAAGRGLDTLHGARVLAVPLVAQGETLGAIAVRPSPETRFEDLAQRHLLEAFAVQIAVALERARLAAEAKDAALRAETEELRSSLLSSVSHDLRTPIASVLGAATTLLEGAETIPKEERSELTATIRDEAARLGRLVGNLLDMSRVESPGLELKKEWVPIEELVGAALTRLGPRVAEREVTTRVPGGLFGAVDPVLFEQLLYNLLENALKHTPAGSPITVRAEDDGKQASLFVEDRGPGVPAGSETRIFEKFVRAGGAGGGVGLGLAICRAIALAHGGSIAASNREGGGASFRVTFPKGEAPSLPADTDAGAEAAVAATDRSAP